MRYAQALKRRPQDSVLHSELMNSLSKAEQLPTSPSCHLPQPPKVRDAWA